MSVTNGSKKQKWCDQTSLKPRRNAQVHNPTNQGMDDA
jgi:hypothetical protein